MVRKEITALLILIIFGFSILISLPVILISFGYSPYYYLEYHSPPIEEVFNSSKAVDLNLNIDIGNVDIQYTYSPVDYHAKVLVNIDMIGQNIPNKNYTDFFNFEGEHINNSLTITMELIPNSGYNDIVWIKNEITIIVVLNPIILFNINTKINLKGNFNLQVHGIDINNIDIFTQRGNILLDFGFCNIKGNISGKSGAGDIELNSVNVHYSRNCEWNLITNPNPEELDISDILINIIQNVAINVNITGTVNTTLGDITLYYTDSTPYVGANFTFYSHIPTGPYEGFQVDHDVDTNKWWQARWYYFSNDYPAIGNYNISCYTLAEDYGTYFIILKNM